MNLNLKVTFKDKMIKVKIYNKIKVKDVLSLLKHELRIPQENELILMNDHGRLSDLDELTEKEMKNLKENWILLEDTDYDKPNKNDIEKKRELTELDLNKIKANKSSNNIISSSVYENRENKDKSQSNISIVEMIKLCTGADSVITQSKIKKKRPKNNDIQFLMRYYENHDDEDDESSYEMEVFEESESENFSPNDINLPYHIGRILRRSHEQIRNVNNALGESSRVQNLEGYSIQPEVGPAGSSRILINIPNPSYERPSMINPTDHRNSNQSLNNPINSQNPYRIHWQPVSRSRLINYDQTLLTELMEMGFPLLNSRIALRASHNNLEIAIHYLINAPDIFFEENVELGVENLAQPVVNMSNHNNNPQQEIRPVALIRMRDHEPNELQRQIILNHIPNMLSSRLQEFQERVDNINSQLSSIQNIASVVRQEVNEHPRLQNARESELINQNNNNSEVQSPIIEWISRAESQVPFSEFEELPVNANEIANNVPNLNISQSIYSEPISEVHADEHHHHHHVVRFDVPMDPNMLSEIQALMAQRGYAMVESSHSNSENAFQNEGDESDEDLF